MGKKRKSGGFRGGKGSDPDFAKKKVKVGKTLAKANSTNTSFRSRAINVAVQRPVENGAGSTEGGGGGATPTNERGLNFQDLLARCGHYQPNTRKDALQGLRSLFSMNTGMLLHSGTLLRLTAKVTDRICDPTPSVRAALALLFRTVLDQVPREMLLPFFPLLIAHTRNAMTVLDAG
eukprot:gene28557-19960_t